MKTRKAAKVRTKRTSRLQTIELKVLSLSSEGLDAAASVLEEKLATSKKASRVVVLVKKVVVADDACYWANFVSSVYRLVPVGARVAVVVASEDSSRWIERAKLEKSYLIVPVFKSLEAARYHSKEWATKRRSGKQAKSMEADPGHTVRCPKCSHRFSPSPE